MTDEDARISTTKLVEWGRFWFRILFRRSETDDDNPRSLARQILENFHCTQRRVAIGGVEGVSAHDEAVPPRGGFVAYASAPLREGRFLAPLPIANVPPLPAAQDCYPPIPPPHVSPRN